MFKSTPTQFQTIIYANADEEADGDNVGFGGKDGGKKRTLEREIANMKQIGYISRIGSPRYGEWEVNIPINCVIEIV